MKALAWHGKGDIRCEEVPDPKIEHPRDAIIKVSFPRCVAESGQGGDATVYVRVI